MDIKRLLNEQRTKRGLTYEQVAQGIGCSSSYVFRVEKGARKRPSFDIVQRIIKFFDLSEEDLQQYQNEESGSVSNIENQKSTLFRIIDSMNVDNFNEVVHLLDEVRKYQVMKDDSKEVPLYTESAMQQYARDISMVAAEEKSEYNITKVSKDSKD